MESQTKRLLLVDDRAKYANLISDFFSKFGYLIDLAVSAKQGIAIVKEKGIDHYRVVVTDVSMEHQLAGLELTYFLHRKKFAGTIVMASTGFDVYLGMFFSKLFMGIIGVHYLIPKKSIARRDFVFYPARPGSAPRKEFVEITKT